MSSPCTSGSSPTVCMGRHEHARIIGLLGVSMSGDSAEVVAGQSYTSRRPLSLYAQSLTNLRVTVLYDGHANETLEAEYYSHGARRDVWTADSTVLGKVVLKLTRQQLQIDSTVNQREKIMYNTWHRALRERCATIFFNEIDVRVMLPGDVRMHSLMREMPRTAASDSKEALELAPATGETGSKPRKVFQLMVQERVEVVDEYIVRSEVRSTTLAGCRVLTCFVRGAWSRQLQRIGATAKLWDMIDDLLGQIEDRELLLESGTPVKLGVRADAGGVASVVVIGVLAIAASQSGGRDWSTATLSHITERCRRAFAALDRAAARVPRRDIVDAGGLRALDPD